MMGGLRLSVISARMCLESDCRLLMLQQAPEVHPQQHRTSGPPPHQKSSQMTVQKQHRDCHMTHCRQEGVLVVPPVDWGGSFHVLFLYHVLVLFLAVHLFLPGHQLQHCPVDHPEHEHHGRLSHPCRCPPSWHYDVLLLCCHLMGAHHASPPVPPPSCLLSGGVPRHCRHLLLLPHLRTDLL